MQKTKLIKYFVNLLLLIIINMAVLSCASHIFIKLTDMEQVDYTLLFDNGGIQHLSAVCDENVCKFVVFDALGMPIVSKEYRNGSFINMKFLPPNKNYDMLFAYIVENKGKKQKFRFTIGNAAADVYKNN